MSLKSPSIRVRVPVSRGVRLCGVCVCVFLYVHGRSDERERRSVGGCVGAGEGGLKRERAFGTHVFVFPCTLCLGRYKTQRGFLCNVDLSEASDLLSVFSVKAKVFRDKIFLYESETS